MKTPNEQATATIARSYYYALHRQIRRGKLGMVAMTTNGNLYAWLLENVYDLRFPHVGSERHALNGVRSFDNLAGGLRSRRWLRIATGRRAAA